MNSQRTVAGLLAVIAALLALNVIFKTSPAQAQVVAGPGLTATGLFIRTLAPQRTNIFRLWSDGSIDVTVIDLQDPQPPTCQVTEYLCGPVQIIGPGGALCTGDFNGSGDVGTADLLKLLGNWGECE